MVSFMGDNSYVFYSLLGLNGSLSLQTGSYCLLHQTMVSYMGDNSYVFFSFRFEWKFKFADRKLLSVTPDYGIIQPNENQVRLFRCLIISLSAIMFIVKKPHHWCKG